MTISDDDFYEKATAEIKYSSPSFDITFHKTKVIEYNY
jgi:hypothetical protein